MGGTSRSEELGDDVDEAQGSAVGAGRPAVHGDARLVDDDSLEVPPDVATAAALLERAEERGREEAVDVALLQERHGGRDGVALARADELDAVHNLVIVAGLLAAELVAGLADDAEGLAREGG